MGEFHLFDFYLGRDWFRLRYAYRESIVDFAIVINVHLMIKYKKCWMNTGTFLRLYSLTTLDAN
jgi:hypothetical protein